jgi:hypothetical protein
MRMIVANKKRIASILNDYLLLSGVLSNCLESKDKRKGTQKADAREREMLSDIIATLNLIANLHNSRFLHSAAVGDHTSYANFRFTTRWTGIGKIAAIEL